jgi:hypothetical protein
VTATPQRQNVVFVQQQDLVGRTVEIPCVLVKEGAWKHEMSWKHLLEDLEPQQQVVVEQVMTMLKVPMPNVTPGARAIDGKGPSGVNKHLKKTDLEWAFSRWYDQTNVEVSEAMNIMAPLAAAFCSEFLHQRGMGSVLKGKTWQVTNEFDAKLSRNEFLVLELVMGDPSAKPKYKNRRPNSASLPCDTAYGYHGSSMYALASMIKDGIKAFDCGDGLAVYCFEADLIHKCVGYGDNISLGPHWPFLIKPIARILMDKTSEHYKAITSNKQRMLKQPLCQKDDVRSFLFVVYSACTKVYDGSYSGLSMTGNIANYGYQMPWFYPPAEASWEGMHLTEVEDLTNEDCLDPRRDFSLFSGMHQMPNAERSRASASGQKWDGGLDLFRQASWKWKWCASWKWKCCDIGIIMEC